MLSLVTAAEQQYHHDVWTRDRELAVLASIRDRRDDARFETARLSAGVADVRTAPPAASEPRRHAAWARPIGVHATPECPQVAMA
jgi:hypothetical protein